jgi:hypothetical protein
VLFQKQEDKLAAAYQPIRRILSPKVETDIAHLLAAREGILQHVVFLLNWFCIRVKTFRNKIVLFSATLF